MEIKGNVERVTHLALIAAGLRRFCRLNLLVAGMRILPVSKLEQILRSSLPSIRGWTGSNEVIGNLKFVSARYHKGLPDSHERGYSLVSDSRVVVSQKGLWKVFMVPGRRFMENVAGAPNLTGASPAKLLHRVGFMPLFQIRKALRLKEFESLYQEMGEFSYRKFHPGIYWRPAIFVSLGDKKCQVYLSLTFSSGWLLSSNARSYNLNNSCFNFFISFPSEMHHLIASSYQLYGEFVCCNCNCISRFFLGP